MFKLYLFSFSHRQISSISKYDRMTAQRYVQNFLRSQIVKGENFWQNRSEISLTCSLLADFDVTFSYTKSFFRLLRSFCLLLCCFFVFQTSFSCFFNFATKCVVFENFLFLCVQFLYSIKTFHFCVCSIVLSCLYSFGWLCSIMLVFLSICIILNIYFFYCYGQ